MQQPLFIPLCRVRLPLADWSSQCSGKEPEVVLASRASKQLPKSSSRNLIQQFKDKLNKYHSCLKAPTEQEKEFL